MLLIFLCIFYPSALLAGSLKIESATMGPGPAIGIVVTRSAPSIDISCVPGVIDYRIVVVVISGIDHRRRLCVVVGRVGIRGIGVRIYRIGVRVCRIISVWEIITPAIRVPSGIQPIVISMAAEIVIIVIIATMRSRSVTSFVNGGAYCN